MSYLSRGSQLPVFSFDSHRGTCLSLHIWATYCLHLVYPSSSRDNRWLITTQSDLIIALFTNLPVTGLPNKLDTVQSLAHPASKRCKLVEDTTQR
jgi:hypothetical protein